MDYLKINTHNVYFLQGETVSTRPTVVLHQEDEQTTGGMLTQYNS